MASTNKTTNYELSQYIGTDKPTYLGDYNSDMLKIDTAIHNNADNITTLSGNLSTTDINIGTLSNLTTEEKSSIVGAINEVDGNCDNNSTAIGTLSNLTTDNKTTIVNAINEVNSKATFIDSYSTTETKTNKVWVDGKSIYRKVFTGTGTGANIVLEPSATNLNLLTAYGFATNGSGTTEMIGTLAAGYGAYVYKENNIVSGNIDLICTSDMTGSYGVVIEYTKVTE